MVFLILFILGLFIGSFLNVVTLRYKEGGSVLGRHIMGGRSHCPKCKEVLHWYELVPLLSFIIQWGKCRHCYESISWQYPIVELLTAVVTAGIPSFLYSFLHVQQLLFQHHDVAWFYWFIGLWLLAAYTLITLSMIDLRLKIIPDSCNILLAIIGIVLMVFRSLNSNMFEYQGSFLGSYTQVLGQNGSIPWNSVYALIVALAFFGGTILLTRGRGMGLGDLKLALAIAFLVSWPDVIISFASAFIIGSLVGLALLGVRGKTMKTAIPFGPYLALGVFVTMLYGNSILQWYFSLVR